MYRETGGEGVSKEGFFLLFVYLKLLFVIILLTNKVSLLHFSFLNSVAGTSTRPRTFKKVHVLLHFSRSMLVQYWCFTPINYAMLIFKV